MRRLSYLGFVFLFLLAFFPTTSFPQKFFCLVCLFVVIFGFTIYLLLSATDQTWVLSNIPFQGDIEVESQDKQGH